MERSWALDPTDGTRSGNPLERTTVFDARGREIRVEQVDVDGPGSFLLCTAHLEDGSELSVLWEGFDALAPDYEREIPQTPVDAQPGQGETGGLTVREAYYGSNPDELQKTAEYVFDRSGRMIRRVYFRRSTGEPYAEDLIDYDDRGRELGYVSRRLDGSRETRYVNRYERFDPWGAWTAKLVLVDGEPGRYVERSIERVRSSSVGF